MRKFVAKIFGVFLLLAPLSAYADVCYTPSQFKEDLKKYEDATVIEYIGNDVLLIRNWASTKIPEDMKLLDFDTNIIASRPGFDNVLSGLFNQGCAVNVEVVPRKMLEEIQEMLKGV